MVIIYYYTDLAMILTTIIPCLSIMTPAGRNMKVRIVEAME